MSEYVPALARRDLGQGQHGGRRPQERQLRDNPIVKGLGRDNYSGGRARHSTSDMNDFDEKMSAPSFHDTRDFREYQVLVEAIVHLAPETTDDNGVKQAGLIKIREIHDELGDAVRREWTLDALEKLKTVELVPGLVDRYRKIDADTIPVYIKRGWTGKSMSKLFSRARGDNSPRIPYGDDASI